MNAAIPFGVAAFIETKVFISPPIQIRRGKDIPVMADDEKKPEPVEPLTPDILRKWALSGKSIPSAKLPEPPEERKG